MKQKNISRKTKDCFSVRCYAQKLPRTYTKYRGRVKPERMENINTIEFWMKIKAKFSKNRILKRLKWKEKNNWIAYCPSHFFSLPSFTDCSFVHCSIDSSSVPKSIWFIHNTIFVAITCAFRHFLFNLLLLQRRRRRHQYTNRNFNWKI